MHFHSNCAQGVRFCYQPSKDLRGADSIEIREALLAFEAKPYVVLNSPSRASGKIGGSVSLLVVFKDKAVASDAVEALLTAALMKKILLQHSKEERAPSYMQQQRVAHRSSSRQSWEAYPFCIRMASELKKPFLETLGRYEWDTVRVPLFPADMRFLRTGAQVQVQGTRGVTGEL